MAWRRIRNLRLFCAVALLVTTGVAAASEYHGQVAFGGLPVPGATVTATQGERKFITTTNQEGFYSFPDLTDGKWTIEIEMLGFVTIKQDVAIALNAPPPPGNWELKPLSLAQINARLKPVLETQSTSASGANTAAPQGTSEQAQPESNLPPETGEPQENLNPLSSNGFLINGSVNNAASSPFSLTPAFGNNRTAGTGLYNGSIGLTVDNSAVDAKPFSLSGFNTPKPAYNNLTGMVTVGGPLKIPHLIRNGPDFFVGYQWTRNRNDNTLSALVPTSLERDGNFSQTLNAAGQPVQIFNPATGLPFPGSMVPVSPQAQALLNLYPMPNVAGNPQYNYQIPIVSNTHQDALESRFEETLNATNQLYGGFALQSTRTATPNLFGFLDTTDILGINSGINWSHRFSVGPFLNLGFTFSRLATRITPYWEDRENVSGDAGIAGNDQDSMDWGPPSLTFSSGVAGLSDAESSHDRSETNALSYSILWHHESHNFSFGGDFRRQEFNYLSQQDPRGTFTFTGAATQGTVNGLATGGSDVADFVLGIPDASSLAFGNSDKYFRESVYDAYVTDDWRLKPQFTIKAGARWEYGAPITELYGRLVNLDIAPGFVAAAPVLASDPVGPLTGQQYPTSLLRPDKRGFEPRVGISWRPIAASSLVIRSGYGVYYDTSVYQTIALEMAQQAPLSKSLSVQNSATCPLTLANGFNTCPSITPDNFAVDPNFRPGYAQDWNLEVQRDLPGSLQLTATYLGIKGTRGVREFLPNTYPLGAVNPCPACPSGFVYLDSNGDSTREAAQIQLRRRLHNGLTALVQYRYSKSIDDDSLMGGQGASAETQDMLANPFNPVAVSSSATGQSTPTIAQNWLDLSAERGLSAFDQRHFLNLYLQYTTGMGIGGHTLLSGWRGVLLKEWTFLTQITVGSGLPETPVYLAAVPGTGVTGSIRPDYTGAPLYAAPKGLFLNPAAYTAPLPGQWGTAGRDSITGPDQFTLNASLGRTFRLSGRFNLDFRVDSTNALNRVTFTSWNATVNSLQFGLPVTANAMRSMQSTLRLRF